jgi:CRP-like cAMP-binding protein
MGIMVSPEVLRRYPFFAGVEHPILKQLAMAGEVLTLRRGEWLFQPGDSAQYLYLVRKGRVEIRAPLGPEAVNHIGVTTLRQGDILGWSCLVEPFVYQMGAGAATKAELVQLNGVALRQLMTEHPEVGYLLMSRVAGVIGSRLTDLRVQFVSLIEGGRWQRLEVRPSVLSLEGGRAKPLD